MRMSILFIACVLMLSGCKEALYSGLSQDEANQMLVILSSAHIDAMKTADKNGDMMVSVDKNDFVDAVDTLHRHGFPLKKYLSVNDVFPSGQLVSSPEQESIKINYLKEQRLEKMLSDIDGVISASVSVAIRQNEPGDEPSPASAAVFIKYSPEINLDGFITQIKSLVYNGVPGLTYESISVVLQPLQSQIIPLTPSDTENSAQNKISNLIYTGLALIWGVALTLTGIGYYRRRKNRPESDS